MSTVTAIERNAFNLRPPTTAIRNVEEGLNETVELRAHGLWRLVGDQRWRMIICVRGEIWITQERDVQDYVLAAGEMFLISQSGKVLIQALADASVEITPSLRGKPYRGAYPIFH